MRWSCRWQNVLSVTGLLKFHLDWSHSNFPILIPCDSSNEHPDWPIRPFFLRSIYLFNLQR